MAMQYDVKQAHLNSSGFFVKYPVRVKAVAFVGDGASDATLILFDTLSTPVSAGVTATRSGTTVTVTKTAHGLSTGNIIGFHGIGGDPSAPTDGTYVITKTGADTFTFTDINTGTISSSTAVYALGKWLATYEADATDVFNNGSLFPGEGIRAETAVYGYLSVMHSATIYYG